MCGLAHIIYSFNALNLKSLYTSKRYDTTLSQSYKKGPHYGQHVYNLHTQNGHARTSGKSSLYHSFSKRPRKVEVQKFRPAFSLSFGVFHCAQRVTKSLWASSPSVPLPHFQNNCKCQNWHKLYNQSRQYGNWKLNSVPSSFRES